VVKKIHPRVKHLCLPFAVAGKHSVESVNDSDDDGQNHGDVVLGLFRITTRCFIASKSPDAQGQIERQTEEMPNVMIESAGNARSGKDAGKNEKKRVDEEEKRDEEEPFQRFGIRKSVAL